MLEGLICLVTRLQGRGACFDPARSDVSDNDGVRLAINGDDVFVHRDYMVDGQTLAKLFRLFVRVNIGALPASFLLGFGNLACIAITSFGKMSKNMLLNIIGGGTLGTASFIGSFTGDGVFMGFGGGADASANLLFVSAVPFVFLISCN